MVAEKFDNLGDKQFHTRIKLSVKRISADEIKLNWDRKNTTRIVLELSKTMTKFRISRKLLETRVVRTVVLVHSLIYEYGEVKTNEEEGARRDRYTFQSSTIVSPIMAKVRQ